MARKVHIDFETRSSGADIRSVGAWRYSIDPGCQVLCAAIAWDDEAPIIWRPGLPTPNFDPNDIYYAHNAGFEIAQWVNQCMPKYGWPEIPLEQWRCTAAMASYNGLPRSLDGASKALGLDEEKDKGGRALMLKMCKPRKPRKAERETMEPGQIFWHEEPEDFERLEAYCIQDVEVERALEQHLRPLPDQELEVWRMTERINQRGILIDMDLVNGAIDILERLQADANEHLSTLTNGELETTGQVSKIVEFINTLKPGLIKNLSKSEVARVLKSTELDDLGREILELRQATGGANVKKYYAMQKQVCDDDRIRGSYLYHGAHTGRWTAKDVQTQNISGFGFGISDTENVISLVKHGDLETLDCLYGQDHYKTLTACIRPAITAKPGHKFICVDYASIEARVLLWLAQDDRGIKMFEDGVDIYCDMASTIYGRTITEDDEKERKLGKAAILGLGYGMGSKKFYETCKSWGIEITKAMAEKVVKIYRRQYQSVVDFWRAMESMATQTMTRTVGLQGYGIAWHRLANRALFCELPGGRAITYNEPKVTTKETPWGAESFELSYMSIPSLGPTKGKWSRVKTWGGKLTENIVQAVARDLMAVAMLKLQARGWSIVMTTHDEIVCEEPEDDETKTVKTMTDIMCDLEHWAAGCPLEAKGWEGKRFRK